jgi:alpha-beta hydrolase superfamily lysophospholipase
MTVAHEALIRTDRFSRHKVFTPSPQFCSTYYAIARRALDVAIASADKRPTPTVHAADSAIPDDIDGRSGPGTWIRLSWSSFMRCSQGAPGRAALHHVTIHKWPARNPLAGLLFVHGSGAESGRLDRLARALGERRISVWAVNALGGRSRRSPRAGAVSMQELADALRALTDLPDPELPLVLGGHSLGGTVAALAACADAGPNTGRYAGLVLTGAPITPPPQVEILADDAPVSLDLSYLYAASTSQAAGRIRVVEPETLRAAWDRLAGRFPVLGLPVMFVHGMSDSIVPARANHAWAQRLKQAEFTGFHGAQHDGLNAVGHRRVATTIADFVLSAALDHAQWPERSPTITDDHAGPRPAKVPTPAL